MKIVGFSNDSAFDFGLMIQLQFHHGIVVIALEFFPPRKMYLYWSSSILEPNDPQSSNGFYRDIFAVIGRSRNMRTSPVAFTLEVTFGWFFSTLHPPHPRRIALWAFSW